MAGLCPISAEAYNSSKFITSLHQKQVKSRSFVQKLCDVQSKEY